ncbi:hypothetical protein [Kitasatospora sp. NBC_01302]|uniref:hypothetical protein n=1 Tax=Kitasatospora sp. NBC_01302 TaxID=2903575 RepID=UPI002E146941|nr:hypothetical protein OG294_24595 [Kitasatospora sp. NBC_01302]
MPAKTKVQDEQEAIRWLREGKSYAWMVEKYLEKYNIQTTTSMWATFRHRKGLDLRITRDADLIPWEVKEEHRWQYPLVMLRFEARRRAGHELKEADLSRLTSWKAERESTGTVVYYAPQTEDGFFYVPREASDTDLIREPIASLRRQSTSAASDSEPLS